MTIPFSKFHGFGNDYIVIEREKIPSAVEIPQLAISICNRHTGAGADGIAVLKKLDSDGDYSCEIVNPDGSVAGFSGNGTRCAAAFLYYHELWTSAELQLLTLSGSKQFHMLERTVNTFVFRAEIGRPLFAAGAIPVLTNDPLEKVIEQRVVVGSEEIVVTAVNVGNPVACIFVDDFPDKWRDLGKAIESHELFPARTNVVFTKVVDSKNLVVKIWERGAGETSSSGTCTSAAGVVSAYLGKTGRDVSVHTDGGVTEISWRDDDEITITGRADLAYHGQWPI